MADDRRLPNRFARYWWLALGDVLGEAGRTTVLTTAGLARHDLPPDDLSPTVLFATLAAINAALDAVYGERGGRDLALRVGRAWFAAGFTGFGALRGMTDPAFRARPLNQRAELGLAALAAIFTRFADQPTELEILPLAFRWTTAHSPFVLPDPAAVLLRPQCQPLVGLLQEALRWSSNGRAYAVREIHCRAAGAAACVISIARQPL